MSPAIAILIVAVVAAIAVGAFFILRRRRTEQLRERFGPEYDRTIKTVGDQSRAEEELLKRKKRVASLNIRPLKSEERLRFAEEWRIAQSRFVDQPSRAVDDADGLVQRVMEARGYPMGNFEQRAADISVDHPKVVQNYRAARDIAQRNKKGQASTEDLRKAMIYYRELFEELLEEPVKAEREVKKQEVLR